MANWYEKVSSNISNLPDCIEYYEEQLAEARKEIPMHGSIEKSSSVLPAIVETRFSQLDSSKTLLCGLFSPQVDSFCWEVAINYQTAYRFVCLVIHYKFTNPRK